jgi:LmbE family N-acetylglucosaminyl deacetylase
MDTERLPSDEALETLAALARRYRPHVVAATQDVSALQSHCSK